MPKYELIILTVNIPCTALPTRKYNKFIFNSSGDNIVITADTEVETPSEVAPPNLLTTNPPRNVKRRPSENELKIYPFSNELQLNSAFYKIIQKSVHH